MLTRTPDQISRWLDTSLYKFDLPAQYLGTEPNAVRRDWDSSTVRWLISASWPYEHGAGNQSIPAVCQAITDADPGYLADRSYLPATPRDMRLLERGEIPAFGVESRRSLGEFDVVGTSISYLVLLMSFTKTLSMSGVPLRWRDREALGLEKFPMVIIGGQAYSAPAAMEPVADCLWLGEVEDEPGNPGGIGQLCQCIAMFKETGLWFNNRLECYRQLALQFPHLHFPRFVTTGYQYQDRGLEHPSKQVASYRSLLPGMAFPRRSRKITDMDKIGPLRSAPLLFADPALGAGDLEVARGSVAAAEYVLVRGQGPRQLGSWRGDALHPHDGDLGILKADAGGQLADVSHVLMNGERPVVTVSTVGGHRVTCTPDHEISVVRGPAVDARKEPVTGSRAFAFSYGRQGRPNRLEVLSQRPREFVRADELAPGADYIPVYYGQNIWSAQEQQLSVSGCHSEYSASVELPEVLDEDVAWLLGMLAGDVTIDNKKSSHTYTLRIQTEDPGVAARTAQVLLRLFGRDVEPWTREGARAGRLTFVLQSAAVLRWLDLNFDITGNHTRRRVPELILRSPRHVVAAYVSGFYDSDGTYDDRTGRPSWCSGSEELIRVLSLLLLNLGAPCSWQRKATRGRFGSAPGSIWMVQGLQAPDGDWSWLHPVHTRRQAQLQRWHGIFAARNGREATGGVIYTPVREISDSGTAETYDLAVPEMSAFTCSGILVHNCPAWCSFCRLSWLTKPYRQRSVSASVQHAKEWHRNMGAVELSPFGPDFPMHSVTLSSRIVTDAGILSLAEILDGKRMQELPFGSGVQVRGRMEPLQAAYHTRTSPVCVIRYSHGLEVHATQEHLVRTVALQPGQSWRGAPTASQPQGKVRSAAEEPLRQRLDRSPETWQEVRELHPGAWVRCYYGRERWPEDRVVLTGGEELTPGKAWLLGLISGDGDVSARLRLRVPDAGVRANAEQVLQEEFGIIAVPGTQDYGRTPVLDVVPGQRMRAWLSQFGIASNSTKRQVPVQIRRSPRDVVAAYVTGCLDADGCVPQRASSWRHLLEVVHSTGSESFSRELAPLVLALGHPVTLNRWVSGSSGRPGWNLTIHSASDADWSWLWFSEASRREAVEQSLAAGLDRPEKEFPGTGAGGVYYAQVQSADIDAYTSEVGDVEVPSTRCFNVNGMVVHNTQKKALITALLEQVNDEADSVAMRVDDFIADGDYIMLQALGGMDAVTLGLEGNCLSRKETVAILGQGILPMEEVAALAGPEVAVGAQFHPVHAARKTGERDLVRVRLSDGKWLDCTPEHRISVTRPDISRRYDGQREALDRGTQEWVQAADLVPGMRIRTFYGQEAWGPEQGLQVVGVPRTGQAASRYVSFPQVLSPELAWLLGLLATDGGMTPNGVRWHVDNDGVEARVREYCRLLFGREPTVDRGRLVSEGAHMRRLNISSRPLVRWLGLNFGVCKGDHRKVPWQVRRSTRAVAEQFLTGVFDGDGWVGREDPLRPSWGVSEAGECEDFHRDLMALLANLGLHCTRRRQAPGGEWGNREKWTLRVSAEDGYDWSWFRPAETSRAAAWHLPRRDRAKLLWTAPADGHAYAEVVSVDALDGLHPVYDIEVPETGSFTASGIIVHNSQRMRDLVGKGTSDKDVEEAFVRGVRAGIRKFKLFMITNLPGETPDDVMRIVLLARRLSELRDELGQPQVRIQFSWTPLLIEAGTPFQWFAPTAADHTLIQVADEFRNYRVDFKIGTKAEPNKVAFFQLCQRASADVGEAIIDVLTELDTACWGGVPRDMRERLEAALVRRGFRNGFADCFDERFEHDLFGWEYIDTGVSPKLMWDTYRQMVEFLENTDAATYDNELDKRYHGQEWVARCDTQCLGNTCGVCKGPDLVKRSEYIKGAADELEILLSEVRPVDQSSIACKIRARITRPDQYRFVLNDHWRFSVRRAAYLAQDRLGTSCSIAKRSIRFASDQFSYKDWTAGTDYIEFGLTQRLERHQAGLWLDCMRTELAPWLAVDEVDWDLLPPSADLRKDARLALVELEVPGSPDKIGAALRAFGEAEHTKLVLRSETAYFGVGTEEVNLRDYVEDAWLAAEGSHLVLRFCLRGPASPYQAAAALLGKPSWIEAARFPAWRLDFLAQGMSGRDALQPSLFAAPCTGCGLAIPESPLGRAWDRDCCPRCRDEARGVVVAAPARRLLV